MNYEIKMTSKGQITLPKEIREQLTLNFGDYLQAQVKDGTIILRPKRNNDSMVLMEYAQEYSVRKPGLKKARDLTAGLELNMTERLRQSRDEGK